MSKRDLLGVALKVTGVILFIQALVSVPWTLGFIYDVLNGAFRSAGNPALFVTLMALSQLSAIGLGLWLALAGDSAANVLERDTTRRIAAPEWGEPLFGIAMAVAGTLLIAHALPGLIELVAQSYVRVRDAAVPFGHSIFDEIWSKHLGVLLRLLAQVTMGVCLLVWRESLARLVFRQREEAEVAIE